MLPAILAVFAPVLYSQTARTLIFRATMLSTNESPSATWDDSGAVDVFVHAVSDSTGNIISASVDFSVTYQFPSEATVIGLGLVSAPAGGSGTITIASGISSASPIHATAGTGRIFRQAQVMPGDQGGLATINGLIANPGAYSVNLLTADHPAGAMSGTLQPASSRILMASLASPNAAGAVTVRVVYTGAPYAITSGDISMQLSYQFPAQVTFASMRIYAGQGQSKPVVPAQVIPGTQSAASGAGMLAMAAAEINMSNSSMVQAVQGMLLSPAGYSVGVGTVEYPTAFLSGQLRGTDSMAFPIANVAGTGAASLVELRTLRYPSGGVQAATIIFDVNYRLAAGTQISGVDIDGAVPLPPVAANASGFGNIYAAVTVSGGSGLASVDDIVRTPENHTLDLESSAPGGAIRAQLAPANTAAPVVLAVIPIVEDKNLNTFAPGELVEIYGTNLAKVTTDLSGWPGSSLPRSLNGVVVAVGGQFGKILYVSPTQVDAELAFETPVGSQQLSLNNGNAPSAPLAIDMSPVAPALYTIVFKNADFSLVSPSNPVTAGDIIVLYATGLGQTTPLLTSGQVIPAGPPFFNTVPVTVTVGGLNANVIYSIAAPPFVAGLYQIAVTVPSGLGPGSLPVLLIATGTQSNAVTIQVR